MLEGDAFSMYGRDMVPNWALSCSGSGLRGHDKHTVSRVASDLI